jgi:pimeloyl-ACP methyl ester carboxylesterase
VANTALARRTLIDEAGAEELSVSAAGSATSVLASGNGRPLLLLHGFNAAGGLVWWPVIALLSQDYRVVAPDLPGIGESTAFEGRPTPSRVVDWVSDVIEELCDEPPVLVATSLSGGFGLRVAAVDAKRLRSLILTDAQGLAPFRPPPGFFVWTTINRLRPSRATARRLARYLIHDQDHVRRIHGSLFDVLLDYLVSQASRSEIRKAMSGYASRSIARPVSETLIEDIQLPVEMIWGRHDQPFPVSIAETVNSRRAWPLKVIEEAGHLPYMEQPKRFADAVSAIASQA